MQFPNRRSAENFYSFRDKRPDAFNATGVGTLTDPFATKAGPGFPRFFRTPDSITFRANSRTLRQIPVCIDSHTRQKMLVNFVPRLYATLQSLRPTCTTAASPRWLTL